MYSYDRRAAAEAVKWPVVTLADGRVIMKHKSEGGSQRLISKIRGKLRRQKTVYGYPGWQRDLYITNKTKLETRKVDREVGLGEELK